MKNSATYKTLALAALVIVLGLLLGRFTTGEFIIARGDNYLEQGEQVKRHLAMLEGNAGNPWQYRILATYLVEAAMQLTEALDIPHHVAFTFKSFRTMQDALVLILAYLYYRKLGLSIPLALIGMPILAWGMSYSHFGSDMQFNTYFDIIFYLLAAIVVLHEKYFWILPITILAALNRETSLLIPLMPLAARMFTFREKPLRDVLPICLASLISAVVIFLGLRLFYGEQVYRAAYGHYPGIDLLQYNFSRFITGYRLFATLSIIPILALIGYRTWPPQLRGFFWLIVPVWFLIHAFAAVMEETRLFLVPQAVVFIPGALIFAQRHRENDTLEFAEG